MRRSLALLFLCAPAALAQTSILEPFTVEGEIALARNGETTHRGAGFFMYILSDNVTPAIGGQPTYETALRPDDTRYLLTLQRGRDTTLGHFYFTSAYDVGGAGPTLGYQGCYGCFPTRYITVPFPDFDAPATGDLTGPNAVDGIFTNMCSVLLHVTSTTSDAFLRIYGGAQAIVSPLNRFTKNSASFDMYQDTTAPDPFTALGYIGGTDLASGNPQGTAEFLVMPGQNFSAAGSVQWPDDPNAGPVGSAWLPDPAHADFRTFTSDPASCAPGQVVELWALATRPPLVPPPPKGKIAGTLWYQRDPADPLDAGPTIDAYEVRAQMMGDLGILYGYTQGVAPLTDAPVSYSMDVLANHSYRMGYDNYVRYSWEDGRGGYERLPMTQQIWSPSLPLPVTQDGGPYSGVYPDSTVVVSPDETERVYAFTQMSFVHGDTDFVGCAAPPDIVNGGITIIGLPADQPATFTFVNELGQGGTSTTGASGGWAGVNMIPHVGTWEIAASPGPWMDYQYGWTLSRHAADPDDPDYLNQTLNIQLYYPQALRPILLQAGRARERFYSRPIPTAQVTVRMKVDNGDGTFRPFQNPLVQLNGLVYDDQDGGVVGEWSNGAGSTGSLASKEEQDVNVMGMPGYVNIYLAGDVPSQKDGGGVVTHVGFPSIDHVLLQAPKPDGTCQAICVEQLTGQTFLDDKLPPTLSVNPPAATVHAGTLTLTGTASDQSPIASVTLNGAPSTLTDASDGGLSDVAFSGGAVIAVGTNSVNVIATDRCGGTTSQTISVTGENNPPVWDAIADPTAYAKSPFTLVVHAGDPDGDPLTYSVGALPAGFSFDPQTRALTFTPTNAQVGQSYPIDFFVSDGFATVMKTITITVAPNQPPTLDPVAHQFVDEGGLLTFSLTGHDPEGETLTYSISGPVPPGLMLDPQTGAVAWAPGYSQSGDYTVVFVVTDPAGNSATQSVLITVVDKNEPPTIDAIPDQSVYVNDTLSLTVVGHDIDGDVLTYSATGLPAGASFSTQTLTWTPGPLQAGQYTVTFTVADPGGLSSSAPASIAVVNRPPQFAKIRYAFAIEGLASSWAVTASDPDGEALTYSASGLPPGATFDVPTHTFAWTPDFTQGGQHYFVTFTVTDPGGLSDQMTTDLYCSNVDQPPVIDPIPTQNGAQGSLVQFTVNAHDPDAGDVLTLVMSGQPAGMTLSGSTVSWTPGYTTVGTFTITFTATDIDGLQDVKTATVIIAKTNLPPTVDAIPDQTVAEVATLTFTAVGHDPNNDALTFSCPDCPSGAGVSAAGVFTWTPTYEQDGVYPVVHIVATDTGGLSGSATVKITVTNTNRPPVMNAIADQTTPEASPFTLVVSGSDPDSEDAALLVYSASGLPPGAAFDPATRTLSWTPGYTQAGDYAVTFTISDGRLTGSTVVHIHVTDTDRPPVVAPAGPFTGPEGQWIGFDISASDPDADPVSCTAGTVPPGASFDSAASFNWTPTYDQSGSYTVHVTCCDGRGLCDATDVQVIITNVNRPPVLDPTPPQETAEALALDFSVHGVDPDLDTLTYSATPVPPGATFDAATGAFHWIPDYTQAGDYQVMFEVTDPGHLYDRRLVPIHVRNTNRAPVVDPTPDVAGREGAMIGFQVIAHDPDSDWFSCAISDAPAEMTFDGESGMGTWIPPAAASLTVHVVCTDRPAFTESSPLSGTGTVTLVAAPNGPPVLDPKGPFTLHERETVVFTLTGSDPDGDALTFTLAGVPEGAVYDAHTHSFAWTPELGQAGAYTLDAAVSDGQASATGTVLITVTADTFDRQGGGLVKAGCSTGGAQWAFLGLLTLLLLRRRGVAGGAPLG